jgi:MoxR-like ATPase
VGKWLAVQSLAKCLGLTARKIRCSADMELEDIVGFVDRDAPAQPSGPLFGNFVFTDGFLELAPRRHQFLMQAMQDRAVDFHGGRWPLAEPCSLFAARYAEEEPSPEDADLDAGLELHDDRFLFRVAITFPPYDEEFKMAAVLTASPPESPPVVLTREEFLALQHRVFDIQVAPPVLHYAVRLVRATRVHEGENLDFIYEWVQRGAGPRAVQGMILAAKARALLTGRIEATQSDVRAVVLPILRHRIVTNRNARSNGITVDRVIKRLVDEIPPRVVGDETAPGPGEAFTVNDWTPLE